MANEVHVFCPLWRLPHPPWAFAFDGLAGSAFLFLNMVPLAADAFLSLLVQRKEPKKHAPGGTPCALRRVRERAGNFRKAHPCAIRKRRPSGAAPFGFYPAHSPRLMGTQKSRGNSTAARADASASALGPPEVRQSRRVKPQRGGAQGCAPFSYRAGCPARKFLPRLRTRRAAAGGPPGCAFFAYFLCTSKESKASAASGTMRRQQKAPPARPSKAKAHGGCGNRPRREKTRTSLALSPTPLPQGEGLRADDSPMYPAGNGAQILSATRTGPHPASPGTAPDAPPAPAPRSPSSPRPRLPATPPAAAPACR